MKRFVSVKIYVLTVVILIVCFCVFFVFLCVLSGKREKN